ncbi:MAG: GlsB/YeaQ/YmgE family stress response membrane protein [Polyangiaceae bacterium]|jgi:uncharacterized membrane protein YeaQ/YmgE (transglycosylase-associated protein family)
MTSLDFVLYVAIACLCGTVARAFAGSGGGFVVSLVVGFLGALIGAWLARHLHLPALLVVTIGGHPFPIIWSIVGGILLVAVSHLVMRPSYAGRPVP